jgi:hypothetical protein
VLTWLFAPALFGIFALHAAPGAWWGDGQELASAAWCLGIPHPTGYPLYMLSGHVWMKLLHAMTAIDPGRALTLYSAAALAIALALLLRAFHRMLVENPARLALGPACDCGLAALLPAVGLTLLVAFSRTLFEHATFAEVYPLTFLFAALLVLQCLPCPAHPLRAALLLAATMGLALLNHYSILALGPLVLLTTLGLARRTPRPWLTFVLALLCGAAMLLGYLYLPLRARANPAINWGDPANLERLKWVLSGGQFKELKVVAQPGAELFGVLNWIGWWGRQWLPERSASLQVAFVLGLALLGLAVFGLIRLARTQPALGWGLLLALPCTATFGALYHIPDIDAYFLPALPVAAIGWLVAVQWALARLRRRRPALLRHPAARALPALLGLIVFVGQRGAVDKSWDDAPQVWGEAALAALPPNAMILTQGDNDIYSLWYQQIVLGRRPDVTVYGTQFIFSGWYRRFHEAPHASPVPLWAEDRKPGLKLDYDVAIFSHIVLPGLATGRPVFTTLPDPLFQEYLAPTTVAAAPLLPQVYYQQTAYPFALPAPFLYRLHPNPQLAALSPAALTATFQRYYQAHPTAAQ